MTRPQLISIASLALLVGPGATAAITQGAGSPAGGRSQATVQLSIDDVSGPERDPRSAANLRGQWRYATHATFTVTLSPASQGAVTVDYATADGSAQARVDYEAASGQLRFAAGETSKKIPVAILPDDTTEGDETFAMNLTNPTGRAGLADPQGIGTIVDDDIPGPGPGPGLTEIPSGWTDWCEDRPGRDLAGIGLQGDDAGNVIVGTDGHDLLLGGGGTDLIFGLGSRDCLAGQDGDDDVHGDNGNDVVRGGKGDDELFGYAGYDVLRGNGGADQLNGLKDSDWLYGDTGQDQLNGSHGPDFLFGEEHGDELFGSAHADEIYGGSGDDVIDGGSGTDLIYCGEGSDEVLNAGADYIQGGGCEDVSD